MLESSFVVAARLRRWWPVGVALGILACLYMARLPPLAPGLPPTATLRFPPTVAPATPTAASSSTTAAPLAAPSPADLRELQQQVVGLRGLSPTGPVAESILSSDDIRRHVLDDFLNDYTPKQAADEALLFSMLDLLDRGIDLRALYRDLYTEQIAGYYDPRADRMYIAAGPAWTGVERLMYVHEFTHALQDQAFDLEAGLGYADEACRQDRDRCRALSALLEGDATLVEEQWLRTYAGSRDLDDLAEFAATYGSPVFDSAPAYIQKDFRFPHGLGLEYVRALYLRDGWAAVDRAYQHPPETTEEILHPGPSPQPPAVVDLGDLASALGDGWQDVERGVLGEWTTRLILETRLDDAEAETAAAGWDGDAYVALRNAAAGSDAFVLLTVWDRPRDAHEFVTAMVRLAEARFGPTTGAPAGSTWTWREGAVQLERAYTQSLWILAPSPAAAEALRQAVAFPFAP